VVPAHVKRGRAKFCSKLCADAARRAHVACICDLCGASFSLKPSMANRGVKAFCSRGCYFADRKQGAVPPVMSTCQGCGTVFSVAAWRVAKGEGTYCSRACRDQHAHVARSDPGKRVTVACAGCGAAMQEWASRPRTYCSNECAGRANVANIAHWAPSAYTATCEQCGQDYQTTPAATRGRFCGRACFAAWMAAGNAPSGEDCANWRGGYLPYYGPSWRPARRAARLRDKVCQDCGLTPAQHGRALDVHHLTPFRTFGAERHQEANDLANLVTLCPPCHLRLEWATNWRRE
jgi:5-methylcytosine-specific restriction endonuclease McrA